MVELHQTVCAIKELRNRHLVLECADQLSSVEDMNAESAAVQEKRKPANVKPRNARIVAWQLKRTLNLNISVFESVVEL